MSEGLAKTAKQIGDELIEISELLDSKMIKWSDMPKRPDGLGETECAGFINCDPGSGGLDLVIDVLAPANKDEALLRLWGIEVKKDSNNNERFNNIQLNFFAGYNKAREIIQKGSDVVREDIRKLLHDSDTILSRIIVSNRSGFDKSAQRRLGKRLDLDVQEMSGEAGTANLEGLLKSVLALLKNSAESEANK